MNWRIGDVEIFQIIEIPDAGGVLQDGIKQATPQKIKNINWLYPDFADKNGKLKATVASFVFKSEGKIILVDTGNGNNKIRTDLPEWSKLNTDFLIQLNKTGIEKEKVDIVISTHLHTDHVGWNTELADGIWKPAFPNAKYLFVKEEYEYWKTKPENEVADDKDAFDDSVKPIIDAGLGKFIASDYRIDKNLELIPASRHTPGHIAISIKSNGEKAIFSGDFIHHPCQLEYPEWTIEYDTFPDKAVETRKKILDEVADTNTLLIGAHFSAPTAGYVARQNGSYILRT